MRKTPTKCTPEIFELVIESLYQGRTIAQLFELNRDNADFPSQSAIRVYVNADNGRKGRYMHAREACADALAEQVLVESDSNLLDPQRARNRMVGRQWLAAKLQPKVYGDKLDVDLNQRVDVSIAIQAARRRSGQVIDNEPQLAITTTDIQSDAVDETQPIDPFS